MATEHGIVIRTDHGTAWVKTVKSGACEGCSSRGACHSLGRSDEMEVKAINLAGAKVGDRIVLSFATASLLKATFLVYLFPILLLMIGALLGQITAPSLNFNPAWFSAILGFSFFFAAFLVIRAATNKMAQKNEYQPKIIRIL